MTQLSNVCGTSHVNNQIILCDLHYIRFNYRALMHMECQNIQPFILKVSYSVNEQPNDNGHNPKLNYIYNEVKSA